MSAIQRVAIGIGLLLSLVFATGVPAASGGGPGAQPQEALENGRGLSHFKQGYYELIPQGRGAEAQQEMARAEEAFRRAIEINPDFVDAHRNLARLYYLQEKFDQAAAEYAQVIRLAPEDVDTYVQMAVVETERGNFQAAVDLLESAKKITDDQHALTQLDAYIRKITSLR